MKRKRGPAIAALVLAASVAMTGIADAKTSPKSWAHSGCRWLQIAFIGGRSAPEPGSLGRAERSFERAGAAYRPTAAEKSGSYARHAWIVRVGALCKADFPKDGVLQEAHFPTA